MFYLNPCYPWHAQFDFKSNNLQYDIVEHKDDGLTNNGKIKKSFFSIFKKKKKIFSF